jgi:prophage antirepressor-like protein
MSILLKKSEFGKIRVEKRGKDFLFCVRDVFDVLGHTNPTVAIRSLDDDERCKKNLGGRQGETWFVTERGLYTLLTRSNKSVAREFRKWITGEVLPSLRKDRSDKNGVDPGKKRCKNRDEGRDRQMYRDRFIGHAY